MIDDNATITSDIKSFIYWDYSSIVVENSTLLLQFNSTDAGFECVDSQLSYNGSYCPLELSPILMKLQYDQEDVDKAIEKFTLTDNGLKGESTTTRFESVKFCLKDGTVAIGNKILYANGDVVEIDEDYWMGTRTYSDGTKISCDDSIARTLQIEYSNGDTYTGTINEESSYPLYANVSQPTFTYKTGTHNAKGVITKWINGETFEARHERLKSVLNEKWLAMVDKDEISENEAIKKQSIEERFKHGASFEGELFEDVHPKAKTIYKYTEAKYNSSSDSKIKKLIDNDVIGYFDIEGIKTELQKNIFVQSNEYKMKYLPKFQEDKKNLLEEEFYFTTPVITGSPDRGIGYYKYDINAGRIEFALRDTKNAEINKGETDFHILLNGQCFTYPRSLVSLHSFQNIMHTRTYDQKLQTCKVSQASALKVDNNSCEMIWMYKIKKFKGDRIYCETTHLYIVDSETKEIYCDLTKSLEASQTNFKSVVNENDKVTYHKQGRLQRCDACLETGLNLLGRGTCIVCNGTLYYTEHWW